MSKDCKAETKTVKPIRDIGKCIQEATDAYNSGKDLYTQIKSGKPDLNKIIADAQAVYTDVTEMVKDCVHIKHRRSFMKMLPIVAPSQKTVQIGDLNKCLSEATNAFQTGKDLYEMFKSGQFDLNKAVKDAEGLYTDVKEMASDCLHLDVNFPEVGDL